MKPIDKHSYNFSKARQERRCPYCGYAILGSHSDTYFCKAKYKDASFEIPMHTWPAWRMVYDEGWEFSEPCTINDMDNCDVDAAIFERSPYDSNNKKAKEFEAIRNKEVTLYKGG